MLNLICVFLLALQLFYVTLEPNAEVVGRILESAPDFRGDACCVCMSVVKG
jgi:hypothetical protein